MTTDPTITSLTARVDALTESNNNLGDNQHLHGMAIADLAAITARHDAELAALRERLNILATNMADQPAIDALQFQINALRATPPPAPLREADWMPPNAVRGDALAELRKELREHSHPYGGTHHTERPTPNAMRDDAAQEEAKKWDEVYQDVAKELGVNFHTVARTTGIVGATHVAIAKALELGLVTDPEEERRPTVVCLCGSGRFRDAFEQAEFDETLAGKIVLTIGCNTKDIARDLDWSHVKPMLDDLHLRKIDMADEVLILNVGGYIGESTSRELAYAKSLGKVLRYLTPTADAEGEVTHG